MSHATSRLAPLLLTCLALALGSCGGGADPFVLKLIADDGDGPGSMGNSIIQTAVDEIFVTISPVGGNRFEAFEDHSYAGGDVEARIDPTGAYFLRLRKGWIDDHAYPEGSTFAVDVPLLTRDRDDPAVSDPTLRVQFLRQGSVIASAERFLEWPIPSGEALTLTILCPEAFRLQCLNAAP